MRPRLETGERRGGAPPAVHCLVPPELADLLESPLTRFFAADAQTRVVVDWRRSERRRRGERRALGAPGPPAHERRRVHALDGRRVGQRRAELTPLPGPRELPAPAREYHEQLLFVRRHPVPLQAVEDLDTAHLVIRLQSGEPAAFDEIYERYMARVYGYLKVALRDPHEAEDAAAEVFLSVLRALPTFQLQGAPFRVWLFRVVRNHAMNHLRKHRRMEVMDPDEVSRRLDGEPSSDEATALAGLGDAELLRLIECLPLVQRQVIVLRYVMGFSAGEVAGILGRSPNAVSQLQRRAFAILRERLIATGRAAEVAAIRLPMRMRLRDALVTRSRRLALTC